METNDHIQLRSDKVRKIIGLIPSKLVRYGITAIFLLFVLFCIGGYFFKFNYNIKLNAQVVQINDTLLAQINIPYKKLKYIDVDTEVTFTTFNMNSFKGSIIHIDSVLWVSQSGSFYKATGKSIKTNIHLTDTIPTTAIIHAGELNIFEYILH